MFEPAQVERILAMHGISNSASDEEITAALKAVHWDHKDITALVAVLRKVDNKFGSHEDVLHHVVRTDDRLQPETIKALLGISIDVSAAEVEQRKARSRGSYAIGQVINIALVSIVLGIGIVIFAMWSMDIGIFQLAAQ